EVLPAARAWIRKRDQASPRRLGRDQEAPTLERSLEQSLDGRPPVVLQRARPGPGEVAMGDDRSIRAAATVPLRRGPGEPRVFVLIEHAQRFIAQLRELCAPPGAALYRAILEDGPDHIDFLTVIYLVPDGLKNSADGGRVG